MNRLQKGIAGTVLLLGGGMGYGLDWELVFPEATASVDELPLLSVGARHGTPDAESPEYLVGSRSGYVLVSDFVGTGIEGVQPVKLPVPFDIQAITSVGANWVVAGPGGQIAYQSIEDPGVQASLTENWHFSQLPINESVIELAATGDNVIALTSDHVFLSQDAGTSWREQQGLYLVSDIEKFRGNLYAIRSELRATTWELELLRSENGESWERVWDIVCKRSNEARYLREHEVDLMVVSDEVSADGFPVSDMERLYLFASLEDGRWNPEEFDLALSSLDGHQWYDHQSSNNTFNRIHNHLFNELVHWNPLGLPNERLNCSVPTRQSGQVAGNLRVTDNQLERYNGQTWLAGMLTHPRETMSSDTTTVWNTLSFIYDNKQGISLSGDGEVTEFALPALPQNEYRKNEWKQMVVADGTYYTIAGSYPPEYSDLWELYPALRITDNFIDWNFIPWPESQFLHESLTLHAVEDQLVSTYAVQNCWYAPDGYNSHCWMNFHTRLYMDEWIDLTETSGPEYYNLAETVYYPPHEIFYVGETENYSNDQGFAIHPWPYMSPPSGMNTFRFSTGESFTGLSVPDNQTIVAFGDTSTLLIVDADGTQRTADPGDYFPRGNRHVNTVTRVNGWNYVVGSALLRTKDFVEFEPLDLPNGEPMTNLVGFRGYLYGFTGGAVYRSPMERGYLDSIEMDDGWYHSEWLGWFSIIDQELGDIEHLLLGTCWVKAVDEQEYWLRTPTLGWIMMIKDWSPWFWRLDDGHWYWLDHAAWPPKAFDYSDQEWVELNP